MEIITMPLGDYQTNCYLVHAADQPRCIVIDPGYEAKKILEALAEKNWQPEAILLTHGHFDHVGAVADIAAETDCDVYISAADLSLPPMITNGKLYYTHTYPADGHLSMAGLDFRVIPTPGHTPGSICLMAQDVIFSGDTLFCGSCGRTDLPGGNWSQILSSLGILADLPGNYRVYPGHGSSTELAWEREHNPYLAK